MQSGDGQFLAYGITVMTYLKQCDIRISLYELKEENGITNLRWKTTPLGLLNPYELFIDRYMYVEKTIHLASIFLFVIHYKWNDEDVRQFQTSLLEYILPRDN